MLARRKRKPRDDEPLVPHGLISQSLEEPQTLENVVPSQPKPPSPAVSPIRRPPARVLNWPQTGRQIRNGLGALSVLARRLQRTSEHFQISKYTPPIRNFASAGTRRITGTLGLILMRLRGALESVQVSTNAARIRKFVSTCANAGLLWCRNWSGRTLVHFRGLHAMSSRRLQEMRAPVRFEEKSANAGSRVRIQLSGIPLRMRIALAHASSGWAMRREALPRNSQLWTSLAMGALSSLLLMGIFSTARHYAKASLPSNRTGNVSSMEAGAAVAPSAIPSRPLKPISENRTLHRPSANPKAKSHETRRTVTTPRKRAHRSEDDDYVAKDTYVYYGNTNSSRQNKPAKD